MVVFGLLFKASATKTVVDCNPIELQELNLYCVWYLSEQNESDACSIPASAKRIVAQKALKMIFGPEWGQMLFQNKSSD